MGHAFALLAFCLLATLVNPTIASGDSPPLSIEKAVEQALKNRPKLSAAASSTAAQKARVEVERSYYLPRVDVNASLTKGLSGSYGKLGIAGLAASPFKSLFGGSVNVWWTAWDFGRTSGRIREAELGVHVHRAHEEEYQHAIALQVREIYLTCVWRAQRITLVEQQLAARQASLALAQQLNESKLGNQVDVEMAHVRLSRANRGKMQRQQDFNRCLVALSSAMAVHNAPFELAAPSAPSQPSAALKTLMENALTHRPEVHRLKAQMAVLDARGAATSADHMPIVKLQASGGFARLADDVDMPPYYAVGLALEVPLYEGGRVALEKSVIYAQAQTVSYHIQEMELIIRAQIGDALEAMRFSAKALAAAKSELERSRPLLDQARARYAGQLSNFVDVAQAELALVQAQEAVVEAQYRLQMGAVRLKYATGQSPR